MKKFFGNMIIKIIAAVIAVIVWFSFANIYDPQITVTISNVPVQLTNVNALAEKGYSYEVLEGSKIGVYIVGPKSKVSGIQTGDITATADLSKMDSFSDYADIDLKVVKDGEEINNITIVPITSAVELNINNRSTKNIPVSVDITGINEADYIVSNVQQSIDNILIVGNTDIVSSVASAKATVDLSGRTDVSIKENAQIKLYDNKGKEINDDSIDLSRKEVYVTADINKIKTVSVECNTSGTPEGGYKVKGVVISESNVTIQGPENVVNGIDKIEIPAEAVDVSGINSDKIYKLWISDYLPDNVNTTTDNNVIVVTVKVEKS